MVGKAEYLRNLKLLEGITHKSFESIIGESIELDSGEEKFPARVEDVTLLRVQAGQERQPFSVILQSFEASSHGQGTYRLRHPQLGDLDLFAVPIGPGTDGMRYEIVFN